MYVFLSQTFSVSSESLRFFNTLRIWVNKYYVVSQLLHAAISKLNVQFLATLILVSDVDLYS